MEVFLGIFRIGCWDQVGDFWSNKYLLGILLLSLIIQLKIELSLLFILFVILKYSSDLLLLDANLFGSCKQSFKYLDLE